jgi:hypothetical protein
MLPSLRFVFGAILASLVLIVTAFGFAATVRLAHQTAKVGPFEPVRTLAYADVADWNQFYDADGTRRFDGMTRRTHITAIDTLFERATAAAVSSPDVSARATESARTMETPEERVAALAPIAEPPAEKRPLSDPPPLLRSEPSIETKPDPVSPVVEARASTTPAAIATPVVETAVVGAALVETPVVETTFVQMARVETAAAKTSATETVVAAKVRDDATVEPTSATEPTPAVATPERMANLPPPAEAAATDGDEPKAQVAPAGTQVQKPAPRVKRAVRPKPKKKVAKRRAPVRTAQQPAAAGFPVTTTQGRKDSFPFGN